MTVTKKVNHIEAIELIEDWTEKLLAAGVDVADVEAVKTLIDAQNDDIVDLEEQASWYESQC